MTFIQIRRDKMNRQETDSGTAIEAKGLVKRFGSHTAVDGVDLSIPKGSVFGFLGPNGAGKTTTIRMLATLLEPSSGSAVILGYDLKKDAHHIRGKISLTGQFASVDEDLTGLENLVMVARLLGFSWKEAKSRAMELLTAFGLKEAAKQQVTNYSGGMRRRLDVAASIVVAPEIMFLDEPTTGLDPRSRNQVWDIIRTLAASGTTVLLTTQYLDEADQLAERIAVIDEGKIIAEGTSRELKASVGAGALSIQFSNERTCVRAGILIKRQLPFVLQTKTAAAVLSVRTSHANEGIAVLDILAKADIEVIDFSFGNPTLDEVFLSLTGEAAGDKAKKEGIKP
jgi:ABC-2 type transport system ATP-binding protein